MSELPLRRDPRARHGHGPVGDGEKEAELEMGEEGMELVCRDTARERENKIIQPPQWDRQRCSEDDAGRGVWAVNAGTDEQTVDQGEGKMEGEINQAVWMDDATHDIRER